MSDFEVRVGDARELLAELEDESVDAVVTSPPYADARGDVENVRPRQFPDWLAPVLIELLRILKPEGSFMLNLGRRFAGGLESDYTERTLARAQAIGWLRIDTIIWHKLNANARGGPYLHDKHEVVYWLARRVEAYRGTDDVRRPYAPETLARYGRRWKNHRNVKGETSDEVVQEGRTPHPLGAKPPSVFECNIGSEKGNPHPTPMAPELAEYLVALACPKDGLVLDPFAGSGNVLRAARKLERRGLGIEISPTWATLAERRIEEQPWQVSLDV
jgi:site-specific DNA-methyltransferase (adenine-specific)